MPTTPRGWPYPALTDQPNAPAQIQSLAQVASADVGRLDVRVSDLAESTGRCFASCSGDTATRQRTNDGSLGLIGSGAQTWTTLFDSIGGMDTGGSGVFTVPAGAGGWYEVSGRVGIDFNSQPWWVQGAIFLNGTAWNIGDLTLNPGALMYADNTIAGVAYGLGPNDTHSTIPPRAGFFSPGTTLQMACTVYSKAFAQYKLSSASPSKTYLYIKRLADVTS